MIRRKRWTPPEPEPEEREKAQSAVADAVRRLNAVIARQSEVDEVTGELKRIRRENHMAPRIASALGAHGE